jgi:hypothetical protein
VRRLILVLLSSSLLSCSTDLGMWIEPPPPLPPEPPTPAPLVGNGSPTLEPSSVEGLFGAPGVHPDLYYYAPDDLWYRYWRGAWYQAFHWDGAWFPPRQVPESLKGIAPKAKDPKGARLED